MAHDGTSSQIDRRRGTKTILVVEDDSDIAYVLAECIRQHTPYHTLWADNGAAALRVMSHIRPDLLILDYRLPGMNGLELYDQLGINAELATIPAILVTANLLRFQLEATRRTMVVLEKPLDLEKLLEVIDKLLA